jgi:hypothetical protein
MAGRMHRRARLPLAGSRRNRSPDESTHVMMPAHHIGGYALVEATKRGARGALAALGTGRRRGMEEAHAAAGDQSAPGGDRHRPPGGVERAGFLGRSGLAVSAPGRGCSRVAWMLFRLRRAVRTTPVACWMAHPLTHVASIKVRLTWSPLPRVAETGR